LDKKTPFYHFYKTYNAKLVSFAGYTMPIQYKGINFEHNYVRTSAGLFDVSHMAQIIIKGVNAFDLVQKITTNNILKLHNGKIQYSCMLNFEGGILDDLLIYQFSKEKYMLVVNASNAKKDFDWISSQNDLDVEIINTTASKGLLAIQGPDSIHILQKITNINLENIPSYSFQIGSVANCPDVIVSKTGYTGSGGLELCLDKEWASEIWKNLFSKNSILEPIGLAARDTLRLEMGYCLYGNDISESRTPLEAGLSWIVDMQKEFIGKDKLISKMREGIKDKLVGFLLEEKGVPRQGYDIFNKKGQVIGVVTSGTMSPSLNQGIGMGYVLNTEAFIDNIVYIGVRDKKLSAKIVKPPFYEQ